MDNAQQATFSVSGWLPNGMKVYFQIPLPDGVSAFDQAFMFTNGLLEKGFRQHEPGLEEGEHRESINVVARRNKTNDDGTTTPVLDLYVANDKMKHRFMAVYLNTDDDVKAFELASGVKLESIPVNPTKAPVDRDVKEFTLQTKPFNVVYTNNPNYDEAKDSMKPKRLFVRWDGQQATSTPENGEKPANANVVPFEGNSNNPFQYDRIKMFMEVAKVAMDVATQERNNTIIKMESEGAFKDIANYQQGVDLVQARLASHRQKASA